MARFTIRLEHRSVKVKADYDKLHAAMQKEGFKRTILTEYDSEVQLPFSEYNKVGDFTKEQVLESARTAATAIGKKFSILVTESVGRAWYNLENFKK